MEQPGDMRKPVILLTLVLLCGLLPAKVYTPADIPLVHLQDRNCYTSNPDGILSPDAVSRIDAAFRTIEDSTGIQALVAVVREINPDDCFEFAHLLGEKAGVGKSGTNNGLVILLCTEERCIQFATGYGVEGILPDAICKRVQIRYMNPHFANEEWDEGMVAGAEALRDIILSSGYSDLEEGPSDRQILLALAIGFIMFGLLILIVVILDRQSRKCPKCGNIALKQVGVSTISKSNGIKKELLTFKCSHCGFITTRNRTSYYSTGNGSGTHLGGGFGGGFSGGGGHFGGSYGGGHFGGGGAGSRF